MSPPSTAAPFPGTGDFNGTFDPLKAPVFDGGQSTYDGAIMVFMLDRALVEAVLPASFRLATPNTTSLTRHPVICMVGNQCNPLDLTGGSTIPIIYSRDYREVILLVPFAIQLGGNNLWHSYAVRMYLDDSRPVDIGNLVFAYAKQWRKVVQTSSPPSITTEVRDLLDSSMLFGAHVDISGPFVKANSPSAPPRWPDLATMLAMPVVGVGSLGPVCSFWEWDLSRAQVAPASASLQFFVPPRAGANAWVDQGLIDAEQDGVVAVRGVRWRLSLQPAACNF